MQKANLKNTDHLDDKANNDYEKFRKVNEVTCKILTLICKKNIIQFIDAKIFISINDKSISF